MNRFSTVGKTVLLLVVLLLVASALLGCMPQARVLESFEFWAAELSAQNVSFTAVYESRRLTNFDFETNRMPESNEWETVRAEISLSNGVWEIYERVQDGEPVRVQDAERIAYYAGKYNLLFTGIRQQAVFTADGRSLFGTNTVVARTFEVLEADAAEFVPFRDSAFATGEMERLEFDWTRIDIVRFNTLSFTYRGSGERRSLQRFEIYQQLMAGDNGYVIFGMSLVAANVSVLS